MLRCFFCLFLCLVGGCAKSTVPVAPNQSPHFGVVSDELQLGGTAYVYADIEGDAERAADFLLSLLRDLPEVAPARGTNQVSAKSLVRILGLDSVKAIGLSSYLRGELFHNRSFLHHTGEPAGLLRLFGGEPVELDLVKLAPKSADFVLEQQVDVGVVLDIVRELSQLGVGLSPEELDEMLRERVLTLDVTLGQLLRELETTLGVILEVDDSRNLWIPGEPLMFPYTDFLFRVDGLEALGDAIIERAASDPFIRSKRSDGWVVISPAIRLPPPWNAYEPSLVKEIATGRLYAVSKPAFLWRCLETTEGVDTTSDFGEAFDGLSTTGNGLMYLSPELTRQLHAVLDGVSQSEGNAIAAKLVRFFLPDAGLPAGWALERKETGLLLRSNTSSSHKSTLLTLGYAALLPAVAVVGASMLGPEHDEEPFEPPF